MDDRLQAVTKIVEDVFRAYRSQHPLPGSIEVFLGSLEPEIAIVGLNPGGDGKRRAPETWGNPSLNTKYAINFFAESREVEEDQLVWPKYHWLVIANNDDEFRSRASERLFVTNIFHWQCPKPDKYIPKSIFNNLRGTFTKGLLLAVETRIIVAQGADAWYWLRKLTSALPPEPEWLERKITSVYPLGQPWLGHAYRARWKEGSTPRGWFWLWPVPHLTAAPYKNYDPFPDRLDHHRAELSRISTQLPPL